MKIPRFAQSIVRGFGQLHVAFFRTFGGRGHSSTLVLITTGRKSGRPISVPLFYVAEGGVGEGQRLYIVASFGGNDEAPGWYRNLLANPSVEVEVGGRRGKFRAKSLSPEEARPIWPKLLELWPSYASYQKKTKRLIPIVELSPNRS
jgi:deazaflavin-dependent oxidoreductase (nitroreductase family)